MEDDYLDLERSVREGQQSLQYEYSQRYGSTQGTVTEVKVGSNAFESVIKESLLKAEDEVLVSSSELIFRLHLEEIIKDLRLKDVSINALCPPLPAVDNGVSSGLSGELVGLGVNARVVKSIPSRYLIVDNRSVSLFLDGYGGETCVQIQSASLCQVLRESFIITWESSRPLTENHKNHMLNGDGMNNLNLNGMNNLDLNGINNLNPNGMNPSNYPSNANLPVHKFRL